jgi:hypothetical protein
LWIVRGVRRPPLPPWAIGRRLATALALLAAAGLLAALSGCGSGLRDAAGDDARADVDAVTHTSCASTVLQTLGTVAERVYRQGIYSERTISALHMVRSSRALRTAVQAGDASGALAAARALIATRHLTSLRVVSGGRVLVDAGGAALAPLTGTLDIAGRPVASFQTSVWADTGLIDEIDGIAEGKAVLRSAGGPVAAQQDLAGAVALPRGRLPAQGTFSRGRAEYQFTSFAASAYPAGDPLRVYLLRTISSTANLCGPSAEDTAYDTLSHIARQIYAGEVGPRTVAQIDRVQGNAALLRAVARRDPNATRTAIDALLHQHIVRLRVSAGGRLLADVGGPYVLAPVTAPLRLHGRQIGSFVLSIQDDEGYKRLANRLAGLQVLMYMGPRLVKSTLGPSPGPIPASGTLTYRGRRFRAYTFAAEAFPSGPLRITVLMALPYF